MISYKDGLLKFKKYGHEIFTLLMIECKFVSKKWKNFDCVCYNTQRFSGKYSQIQHLRTIKELWDQKCYTWLSFLTSHFVFLLCFKSHLRPTQGTKCAVMYTRIFWFLRWNFLHAFVYVIFSFVILYLSLSHTKFLLIVCTRQWKKFWTRTSHLT